MNSIISIDETKVLQLPNQKIYISGSGNNVYEHIATELYSKYDKIVIIAERKFWEIFGDQVKESFEIYAGDKFVDYLILDAKTTTKTIISITYIVQYLHSLGLSRNSCAVAIGGGYIGDLVGVATGLYMRGIDFYQLPTTLMAQCDAIIGKVAANLGSYKNVIGLFRSPNATYCNIHCLTTLPKQELYFAFSELVKHLLITYKDVNIILNKLNSYILYIEQGVTNNNIHNWIDMIHESLYIKSSFVLPDPYDKLGIHKALSLGHTFANVIETLQPGFRHGQAVLLGLIMCLDISEKIYGSKDYAFINAWLLEHFNADYKHLTLPRTNIIETLTKDKLAINSHITFVLLSKLGEHQVVEMDDDYLIKEAFSKIFSIYV